MPLPLYQPNSPLSQIKNIIAIAAGKGGVGKSTVTVNLAYSLQKMGYKIGIMDTDVYGPSIRKMLPENKAPKQSGKNIIPALAHGMSMMSMAYFRKEEEAAVIRAPIANGIISQFINNVEWGILDFLLIDFPPGTGDIQLTICQQANITAALLVTTPQAVATTDVQKAIHMFNQLKVPCLGVVENMSYYIHEPSNEKIYLFGKNGGHRLAIENGIPFLGEIPVDPFLSHICDKGESLFSDETTPHPCVPAFCDLAKHICLHSDSLKNQSKYGMDQFELIWKEHS